MNEGNKHENLIVILELFNGERIIDRYSKFDAKQDVEEFDIPYLESDQEVELAVQENIKCKMDGLYTKVMVLYVNEESNLREKVYCKMLKANDKQKIEVKKNLNAKLTKKLSEEIPFSNLFDHEPNIDPMTTLKLKPNLITDEFKDFTLILTIDERNYFTQRYKISSLFDTESQSVKFKHLPLNGAFRFKVDLIGKTKKDENIKHILFYTSDFNVMNTGDLKFKLYSNNKIQKINYNKLKAESAKVEKRKNENYNEFFNTLTFNNLEYSSILHPNTFIYLKNAKLAKLKNVDSPFKIQQIELGSIKRNNETFFKLERSHYFDNYPESKFMLFIELTDGTVIQSPNFFISKPIRHHVTIKKYSYQYLSSYSHFQTNPVNNIVVNQADYEYYHVLNPWCNMQAIDASVKSKHTVDLNESLLQNQSSLISCLSTYIKDDDHNSYYYLSSEVINNLPQVSYTRQALPDSISYPVTFQFQIQYSMPSHKDAVLEMSIYSESKLLPLCHSSELVQNSDSTQTFTCTILNRHAYNDLWFGFKTRIGALLILRI